MAFAKQTAFGTPNVTPANYRAVKITGDSLVASNNPLAAENEIGVGRDISAEIPGGFSSAGAINGILRARSAATLLQGALGTLTAVAGAAGPPITSGHDEFTPADILPVFTVEKKVGSNVRSASELLTLRYTDVMVNTMNISCPSAALSTFSAGLIACGEQYLAAGVATVTHAAASDDIFAFHGGRIRAKDTTDTDAVTFVAGDNDTTFQSFEVAVNNNVQADEYTIRPSRFLRSLTEGIRNIECNITLVFEDYAKYQKYTYGATGRTLPGYSLYQGALQFTLANWQLIDAEFFNNSVATGAPANPQAVEVLLPKVVFTGLPVALSTGRIAVTTSARALKPTTGNIIKVSVRPTAAGF